jgi:hypothetical protein
VIVLLYSIEFVRLVQLGEIISVDRKGVTDSLYLGFNSCRLVEYDEAHLRRGREKEKDGWGGGDEDWFRMEGAGRRTKRRMREGIERWRKKRAKELGCGKEWGRGRNMRTNQ